jgi:small subunit ribosomal protein S14
MATQGKISTNERRKKLSAKFAAKRAALKAVIRNPKSSEADKVLAQAKLNALPRNSNINRVRNRCALTGRPRAVYRKFGLSRIAIREKGLAGEIPGLTKPAALRGFGRVSFVLSCQARLRTRLLAFRRRHGPNEQARGAPTRKRMRRP